MRNSSIGTITLTFWLLLVAVLSYIELVLAVGPPLDLVKDLTTLLASTPTPGFPTGGFFRRPFPRTTI